MHPLQFGTRLSRSKMQNHPGVGRSGVPEMQGENEKSIDKKEIGYRSTFMKT